ncbi:TPA: AraC family transcriptional regulator [Klebsiella pneumoniae]|nr:AraC family transcriptional regulator [Klebsiella pneumoniae]
MSQPAIDLTSELLRGMRLSGVNYRRIETARPFGVGFSAVAGKAQFHFISRGPVLLRMASGEQFTLESGDALFIPNGDGHALLSDPQATVVNVAQLPSETVCSTVSCINAGDQPDCPERAVIFSGCMDFELGGMQPLVKTMPEVMRVSSLLNTWPEIQPLLVAMERESLTRQAGYAGILARLADVVAALIVRGWVACGCGNATGWVQVLRDPRLADVVAALIVRGWVACGCGNATGWVQVLRDPRLAKAIYAMHQRPGVNWKVEDLAREAGLSRSLFAERFLAATGTTPARYLTELRMRLAVQYITHEGQALEKVAFSLGYQSLAAFSRAFKRITGQPPGALRAMAR